MMLTLTRGQRLLSSVPNLVLRSLTTTSSIKPATSAVPWSAEDVQASLESLRLTNTPHPIYTEYKLPSFNLPQKNTKVDPLSNKLYKLPTISSTVLEKFTPSASIIVPIEDPHRLQQIVDRDGIDAIEQHCMPSMFRIRRLKMNKHRLKKIRKKNLFMARKLTRIKKAKKERAMREFEVSCRKKGEDFSAEKFVDEKLVAAREGGWHIDIWKEYQMKKSQHPN